MQLTELLPMLTAKSLVRVQYVTPSDGDINSVGQSTYYTLSNILVCYQQKQICCDAETWWVTSKINRIPILCTESSILQLIQLVRRILCWWFSQHLKWIIGFGDAGVQLLQLCHFRHFGIMSECWTLSGTKAPHLNTWFSPILLVVMEHLWWCRRRSYFVKLPIWNEIIYSCHYSHLRCFI